MDRFICGARIRKTARAAFCRYSAPSRKCSNAATPRGGLDSPYVFCRVDGRPLKCIIPAWKAAAARAGLACTPHDFRRSAVRNLVRSGVPEKTAMDWTGHLTRSIFNRYDITSTSDLDRAAEKLAAYVSAKSARPSKVVPLHRSSKKLANFAASGEKTAGIIG
jgi:integrase